MGVTSICRWKNFSLGAKGSSETGVFKRKNNCFLNYSFHMGLPSFEYYMAVGYFKSCGIELIEVHLYFLNS